MIGKAAVKKSYNMQEKAKKLHFPKTSNFTYANKDLEKISKDYIKSLISQDRSQLTINEYARTISHFLKFCKIYLAKSPSLNSLKNFNDIDFLSYQSFYLGRTNSFENLKDEMLNGYYYFESTKPLNLLTGHKDFFKKKRKYRFNK